MSTVFRRRAAWAGALIVAAGLSAAACDPSESFSDVPEIAALRVTQKDSVLVSRVTLSLIDITVSWKDGNGDLGYLEGTGSATDLNYFIVLEKKKAGNWVTVKPPTISNTGYNGRFINLNPEGTSSTKSFKLRGELTYRLNGNAGIQILPAGVIGTVNGVNETARAGDVFRFKVQIKDRANNFSNQVTTEEVTL